MGASCNSHRTAEPTVRAFEGFREMTYIGVVAHTTWLLTLPKQAKKSTITGKINGSESGHQIKIGGFEKYITIK